MANHTLNASINETLTNTTTTAITNTDVTTAITLFFTIVIPEILSRFFAFVAAPFVYPMMWWLLIHLILTFTLFEFYFERHEEEDLGWTAALANSVVMIFISAELLREIYGHAETVFAVAREIVRDALRMGLFNEQMIIVSLIIFLGIMGITTAIINYYHLLPRSISFIISGHKTVNLLAYFLIVTTYRYVDGTPLPLDGITFTALLLFGAMLWSFTFFVAHHRTKKKASRVRHIPFK